MSVRGPYDSPSALAEPITLGMRLRWLRKQRGLTQVEVAEALGCEQTLVSTWEVDKVRPSAVTLTTLARFHQLPPDVLETGKDFMALAEGAVAALRDKARAGASEPARTRLEPVPPGRVAMVDLMTDRTTAVDSSDAMAQFLRAMKKGRPVWIVMG
jgi:transcriptional regulator with XRE-family HTH domain